MKDRIAFVGLLPHDALTKPKHVSDYLTTTFTGYRMDVVFVGADKNCEVISENEVTTKYHFYLPNCPNGIEDVPGSKKILYRNIYKNIDLEFSVINGKLKYNFIVKKGADYKNIKLKYVGNKNTNLLNTLSLQSSNPIFNCIDVIGDVYYRNDSLKKNKIVSGFNYNKGIISFYLQNLIPNEEFIIDPQIEWATYLGGYGQDVIRCVKVDKQGNSVIAGFSASTNFPITTGAFQGKNKGGFDIINAKFSPDGQLLWSTLIGGSDNDGCLALGISKDNNYWLAGDTRSNDFPITMNAFQQQNNGGSADAVIAEFAGDGKRLFASYAGGFNYDVLGYIGFDKSDNIWIYGDSFSPDYPITSNAYKKQISGNYDAVLMKLAPDGSLLYSSFFGGNGDEFGFGFTTDEQGCAYVGGFTSSTDLPVNSKSFQQYLSGSSDAFIAKFDPNGNFLWSTYFGGSGGDESTNFANDGHGNLYIRGTTTSTDLKTDNSVFQKNNKGGTDFYIAKFTTDGGFIWVTYLGGNGEEDIVWIDHHSGGLEISPLGLIGTSGKTTSSNFFTTPDCISSTLNGPSDAIVFVLDTNCKPIYSTYLGGNGEEQGYDLAFSSDNSLYAVGMTNSSDFPVTQNAYQTKNAGGYDGYIVKLGLPAVDTLPCKNPVISFDAFRSDSGLCLAGDASIISNAVKLTNNNIRQKGAAWFNKAVPVSEGFTTVFSFKLSDGSNLDMNESSSPGADGLAFVIRASTGKLIGATGSGIGYDSIPNSVAVEFDTYWNDFRQTENRMDPNGNHIAVQTMGTKQNTATHSVESTLGISLNCPTFVSNGSIYYGKIVYDSEKKTLDIYSSTTKVFGSPALTISNFKLDSILNLLGGDFAFLGFTSSTGRAVETHEILSWSTCVNSNKTEIDTMPCGKVIIDFDSFPSPRYLVLKGVAGHDSNFIRVSDTRQYNSGSVWFNALLPVSDGFTTDFRFRLSQGSNFSCFDNSLPGADGIAFLINAYTTDAIGYYGGGIGYHGIQNSVAVEFDTFSNDSTQIENFHDPNGNHVAVQTYGRKPNSAAHSKESTLGITTKCPTFKADGGVYYARITYNKNEKTLRVYASDSKQLGNPLITVPNFKLDSILNLYQGSYAFLGFTSATGCASENHDLLLWKTCISSQLPVTSVEEMISGSTGTLDSYPNPASEYSMIRLEEFGGAQLKIVIVNLLGEVVQEPLLIGEYSDSIIIDLKDLPAGVYFAKITAQDKIRLCKLVKI